MNRVEINRQLLYRLVWPAVGGSAENGLLTKTFRSRKASWRRCQTKRKRIKSQGWGQGEGSLSCRSQSPGYLGGRGLGNFPHPEGEVGAGAVFRSGCRRQGMLGYVTQHWVNVGFCGNSVSASGAGMGEPSAAGSQELLKGAPRSNRRSSGGAGGWRAAGCVVMEMPVTSHRSGRKTFLLDPVDGHTGNKMDMPFRR